MGARRIFRHDADIGHTYIPHLRARIQHESGGYLIKCNEQGFRSHKSFNSPRPTSRQKILLFGDSFTAGDGVSNQYRYSDVLESELNNNVEIYNFGLSGTGTDQQFLCFKKFGRNLDADLLVLGIYVENVRRNLARYRPFLDADGVIRYYQKPSFSLTSDGSIELNEVPVPRYPVDPDRISRSNRKSIDQGGPFRRTREFIRELGPTWKLHAQQITRYQPLREYNSAKSEGWRLMSAIVTEWVSLSSSPVVLFPIPLHQYVEQTANPEPMRSRFRELAKNTGCTLVDPLPTLWQLSRNQRRRLRFADDPHPTKYYHDTLAKILGNGIAQFLHD